jgi:hypothetical protein
MGDYRKDIDRTPDHGVVKPLTYADGLRRAAEIARDLPVLAGNDAPSNDEWGGAVEMRQNIAAAIEAEIAKEKG